MSCRLHPRQWVEGCRPCILDGSNGGGGCQHSPGRACWYCCALWLTTGMMHPWDCDCDGCADDVLDVTSGWAHYLEDGMKAVETICVAPDPVTALVDVAKMMAPKRRRAPLLRYGRRV